MLVFTGSKDTGASLSVFLKFRTSNAFNIPTRSAFTSPSARMRISTVERRVSGYDAPVRIARIRGAKFGAAKAAALAGLLHDLGKYSAA